MNALYRSVAALSLIGLVAACAAPTAPTAAPQTVRETVVVTQIVQGTPETIVITATPEPALAGSDTVVIRVGTGDGGEGLSPHQQIIQNYEDAHPDIIAQLEPVAGRDYYARLLTQLAAKAAPDIMQIGDDAVPSFVEKGAFLPLDECLQEGGFDPSVYLPGLLTPGQVDGQQYLLPKDYSPLGVYYNKKIFDAAGVAYPEADWTWEDLLATAQQLTRDADGDGTPEVWGIQLPATWTTGFEYWVAAAGGSLISEDGTSFVGYMDSPETIRAVQFYADLYNTHKVAPPPADLNAFGGGNSEFDNGQAAMRLFGIWPQSGMLKNPNIDLGVVNPPAGAARANILFWGGFGISSTTQNLKAACDFLAYYTGEPAAEVWKDWALPAVTSVAESSGQTTDPIKGVWIGELNHIVPRAYTYTPYWNETADPALRTALETVLLDPTADVAAVMAQAAQDAQQALDAAR
ncbi:MAG TPA: sugar ABC transporter substrate-binding protein [Anaerolineales bacterium]|nr:sugar ABC transporter substrate-binding protein [Anaerolineales bacterium]